jgi:hypothetical protein
MARTAPRFSYYNRLSARNKAIYRRGDAITRVALPDGRDLRAELCSAAAAVGEALAAEKPSRVRAHAQHVCDLITKALATEPVTVKVLRVRPQRSYGELHGLYTRDDGNPPTIRVWMRTAQRADVVKPRTFLRLLLHEVCHHLDYAHYRLGESFHNPGFFKRESSLMRLVTPAAAVEASADPPAEPTTEPASHRPAAGRTEPREPVQLRFEDL